MSIQSPQSVTGFPRWVIVLGMLSAIAPLSIDMYLPSFPAIATALHTDIAAVQRTLATFFIGLAAGQLVYGPISDRFGRKPPLYFGLALYSAASLLCAFAVTVDALQWGRLLQALGGCTGMVIARAVVRDRCDAVSSAKVMSLIMLVMGVAPILAPLIGGFILQALGWRAIFGVLAVFGAICLFAIHFSLEESHDRTHAAPLHMGLILKNYAELLRDRHFLTLSLSGGLAQAMMFTYITGSPFVLIEHYGIPAQHYGWIFGCNAFGLIAASQINARLLHRFSPQQLLNYTLSFAAALSLALLLLTAAGITGLPLLLPALFGCVGVLGFVTPNSVALALQHQGKRAGAASALVGMLQLGVAAIASSALSLWNAQNELPLTIVMACCGVGALAMYKLAPREILKNAAA
ncbi:MAG: h16 [Verrucomicrobiaceae bacterium]|nr:h16 [Verrucomicrobiaceae bacterium]